MVRNGWQHLDDQAPTVTVHGILFFVHWFAGCYRDGLVEAHARAVMTIGVYVREYGHKEARLLSLRRQGPSLRLTKLHTNKGKDIKTTAPSGNKATKRNDQRLTHSIPSMNGVSGQSFSGNLCRMIPLLVPLPDQQTRQQQLNNSPRLKETSPHENPKIRLLTLFLMMVADDDKVVGQPGHLGEELAVVMGRCCLGGGGGVCAQHPT